MPSPAGCRYVRLEVSPFDVGRIGRVASFHARERMSSVSPTRFLNRFSEIVWYVRILVVPNKHQTWLRQALWNEQP